MVILRSVGLFVGKIPWRQTKMRHSTRLESFFEMVSSRAPRLAHEQTRARTTARRLEKRATKRWQTPGKTPVPSLAPVAPVSLSPFFPFFSRALETRGNFSRRPPPIYNPPRGLMDSGFGQFHVENAMKFALIRSLISLFVARGGEQGCSWGFLFFLLGGWRMFRGFASRRSCVVGCLPIFVICTRICILKGNFKKKTVDRCLSKKRFFPFLSKFERA